MKKLWFTGLLLVILLLTACSNNHLVEPEYDGRNLKIAVIGEFPEVREKNVLFEKTSFEGWKTKGYDAVFISEQYLAEAANAQNIQKFKESKIPVFFLGTKASYIPFIELENPVSYEQHVTQINDDENPIAGILYKGKEEGYQGWTFSYPVVDSKIIRKKKDQEIYSLVFNTIGSINQL